MVICSHLQSSRLQLLISLPYHKCLTCISPWKTVQNVSPTSKETKKCSNEEGRRREFQESWEWNTIFKTIFEIMLRCVKQKVHEKNNDMLCKIPRGEAKVVLKWLLVTFRTHFKMFVTSDLAHSPRYPFIASFTRRKHCSFSSSKCKRLKH